MILKGSQRGNGADLAIHLMNGYDNERIEIAEVYGTVAGDLFGAFAEFEAVASGTKAKEYLYSLSINPPSPLSREQYHEAIQDIEHRLGLTDQPRAVVFHFKPDKDGIVREHCHVVWSRINVENMRAIQMSYDRTKLMDVACELAHKYGLDLPPGLKAWEEKRKRERDKLDQTLAEKAQAEETGITPEQRRAEITATYEQADSPDAFRNALEEKGYVLAKGDRRGMVIVDQFGDVHSLTRYIKGHSARQIRARLAPLTPDQLPDVDQAKEMAAQRAQASEERRREQEQEEAHDADEERARELAALRQEKEQALSEIHAARRLEIRQAEQELLTRQQAEKLALHAAQKAERSGMLFRMRSAVAELMKRTPGLRSVLTHIQNKTGLDPRERHRLEDEALARRHAREKRDIARRKRMAVRLDTRERQSFEKSMRRAERMRKTMHLDQQRRASRTVKEEFLAAASDHGSWKKRMKEGDLRRNFNDEAGFIEGAHRAGDDDDGGPGWKHRAEEKARAHRPRRGRGYGRQGKTE